MTGNTHKFIGIVLGGSIACYGTVILKDYSYMLALLSTPIGAMIPDIDHDNSKIGASRKKITKALSSIGGLLIFAAVLFFLMWSYQNGTFRTSLITVGIILIPLALLSSFTKIRFIKDNLNFMVKHRGLMHTLILPLFMFGATFIVTEPLLLIVLQGLLAGYITHIFADLLTSRGCPILYPLTKRNFKIANIKTGSRWEYIAMILIDIIILGATIMFTVFSYGGVPVLS